MGYAVLSGKEGLVSDIKQGRQRNGCHRGVVNIQSLAFIMTIHPYAKPWYHFLGGKENKADPLFYPIASPDVILKVFPYHNWNMEPTMVEGKPAVAIVMRTDGSNYQGGRLPLNEDQLKGTFGVLI